MNKNYRLIWNDTTCTWVAVSELVKARGKKSSSGVSSSGGSFLLKPLALMLATMGFTHAAPPLPTQLPTGGQVVAGTASIVQSNAALNINQSSARAAIDWQTFNVGSAAAVNFNQPNAASVTLNRVLDSNPSQIFGRITAPGQVFLTNPSGVYFAPGASVNVGALTATTHSISNEDFMAGNVRFSRNGATGAVINDGNLTAALGGYIALLAPEVRNNGVIVAQLGTVALAAGESYALQFDGNNTLANILVTPATIAALVENGNAVHAPGGLIILSAQAADQLQGSVVKNSGAVEAQGITTSGGVIRLDAGNGQTTVSGTLDASSATGQGGRVQVTGDRVLIDEGAHLTASGKTGGGEVLVGGSWQNSDPSVRQATGTYVAQTALLEASATGSGNGGTVVAWSDVSNSDSVTRAYGTFEAKGGVNGGNGGRIETSGHWLDVKGISSNASSSKGTNGMWLLDPTNVTITTATANGAFTGSAPSLWTPTATTGSTILNTTINAALDAGTSVTITTTSGAGEVGDITVSSAITKASGNADVTLTLQAANSIMVDQAISNTGGTGKLHVTLDADNNAGTRDGVGVVLLNNDISTGGGNLSFGTGATMTINGVTTKVGGDVYVVGTGARSLTTAGGNVTVNGEMILANTSGLTISTSNGNVTFGGLLNSGNSYTSVYNATAQTWTSSLTAAKGGTTGGNAVNDTYLATITSRLENAVASRTVNYNTSWLGGQRKTGISTDAVWRWVTGPEGLEDSGNGRQFFTQVSTGSGGTAINGSYSNWNGGEPNNCYGGTCNGSLNVAAETALQFTLNTGVWNDLNSGAGATLNYYVKETNLSASPLTVDAGTGTVTFAGAVGGSKALVSLNVTAGTIAVNGGAVTTEGLQTYTGNVTLGSSATVLTQTNANTDFTLQASKTISNATGANASLTIKTTRDILLNSSSSISSATGALGVTLNSDSDAASGGAIVLNSGSSISSNGGAITLSGGANVATGYAQGQNSGGDLSNGISLLNASLVSNGGDITLRGQSAATVNVNSTGQITGYGILMGRLNGASGTVLVDSGSGKISLTGVSTATTATANAHGMELGTGNGGTMTLTIKSASSASDAIVISGTASTNSAVANSCGVVNFYTIETTNGGGINITGIGGPTTSGFSDGIYSAGNILSNSGLITLTGTGSTSSAATQDVYLDSGAYVGYKTGTDVTASSGAITLNVNSLFAHSTSRLQSSGALTVQPRTAGTTIGIAGGAGTLALTAANFSTNFVNGFSGITVGTADAGTITVGGATTFNDSTTLLTNSTIAIGGVITANENLALTSNGAITQTQAVSVTGTTSITAGTGNNVTLDNSSNNFTGVVSVTTAQNLALIDSNAMTLGAVTSTGTVDIATLTNDLILTGAIITSNTTATALTLNAAKNTAAGTDSGGNIVVNGGSVSVGSGGRATLLSGSVSGSTGLTMLVGSGSGKFRYNSDETTTNYTTALGAGTYAVYREQPTVTTTAGNQSKTYNGVAYSGGNGVSYSGFVNGETSAMLGGTLVYGGSSQGATNAGSYFITPSGYTNGLGYVLTYANGALTITQAPLSVTASNASKTYNGLGYSGGNGATYSGFVNNETSSVLGGTLAYSGSSQDAINAGDYVITLSGLTSGNYTLSFVNGALKVTGKSLAPPPPPPPPTPLPGPNATPPLTPPGTGTTGGTGGKPDDGKKPDDGSGGGTGSSSDGNLVPQGTPNAIKGLSGAPGSSKSGGSGDVDGATAGDATKNGISVSLVREPSLQMTGIVTVLVPKETATAGSGFTFPLPEQVAKTAVGNTQVRVTTLTGGPLPDWLRYAPDTKTFVASAVPDGAFPTQVLVTIGKQITTVVISERSEH